VNYEGYTVSYLILNLFPEEVSDPGLFSFDPREISLSPQLKIKVTHTLQLKIIQ